MKEGLVVRFGLDLGFKILNKQSKRRVGLGGG